MPAPRYQIDRPAIIDETLAGEVVAVDLAGGRYYCIRGSGVAVWDVLGQPASVEDVVLSVAGRYGRNPEDVREPVERFVAEIRDAHLLREDSAPSDVAPNTPVQVDADQLPAFDAPVLETYTDMEDLLMLDPVDDVEARGWPSKRGTVDPMGWPSADAAPG